MPKISVISPIYKAENCIHELCSRLHKSLSLITEDYEILLIDDRSPDSSWELILKEVKKSKKVKAIRLTKNFGQHYAITAGIDAASGDWIVIMDCDLQDPPEQIINLYNKALTGETEVVTALFQEKTEVFYKQWISKFFWLSLSWLSGIKFDPRIGNFRIISRKVVENFKLYNEHLRFLGGILAIMGHESSTVPMDRNSRFSGKSSYNLRRQLIISRDIIMAYSDKPLKIFVSLGFIISFISILAGITIITLHLNRIIIVPGWASVMVSLYFLGGIIIANLGLIGVYLGRTFDETKRRPLYLIDRKENL